MERDGHLWGLRKLPDEHSLPMPPEWELSSAFSGRGFNEI
jgi:hypothetical protein